MLLLFDVEVENWSYTLILHTLEPYGNMSFFLLFPVPSIFYSQYFVHSLQAREARIAALIRAEL